MRITILYRPAADLSAVELEVVQAQGFRGGEAVRARRHAHQTLSKEVGDRLGPSGGVVATRDPGDPHAGLLSPAGAQVIGEEGIETAAGKAQFFGGAGTRQGTLPKGGQDMADESGCVSIG